jgi:hypothetical protein
MVYDIDIHQLNLEQFKKQKNLNEIPFKKCVFLQNFSSESIIISSFKEKTTII